MGFVDKLKNIFFEEEEEEVENEVSANEVIAKKVEVPKRKVEPVEIEVTKEEVKKEPTEPKKEVIKPVNDLIFDDEDFLLDTKKVEPKEIKKEVNYPKKDISYKQETSYKSRENRDLYKKEENNIQKETPKYDFSYSKNDTKDTKTFTPSPIISPIYGILDKNYKKEEIKEKKEVRISSYTSKMDLDSVRNKAFGDLENDLFGTSQEKNDEEEEQRKIVENRKIYDFQKKDEKPTIDKVTIGEADEYYNDLGLAYNTDYKDISKEIKDGKYREVKKTNDDLLEDNLFDLIESMYDKED